MTVLELIEKLSKLPQNLLVYVSNGQYDYHLVYDVSREQFTIYMETEIESYQRTIHDPVVLRYLED